MSDAIVSITNNLPVDAMNIMAMLFDKGNIVNSYKLVANGHGFSFTLQLNQTNKEQPSALSTPRTMGSYKSPSSRSRDQKRYREYMQQGDIVPKPEIDSIKTNIMDSISPERDLDANVNSLDTHNSGCNAEMHSDPNEAHHGDCDKCAPISQGSAMSITTTPDSTEVDNDPQDDEPVENKGPPKNKVYPGILTARNVLIDNEHNFRNRIMDESMNNTFV